MSRWVSSYTMDSDSRLRRGGILAAVLDVDAGKFGSRGNSATLKSLPLVEWTSKSYFQNGLDFYSYNT